ncbi:MAG TPA: hypothetical protein VKY92_22815 [Verrucomicrobiae bacterium]|nr:hypothetical protein [Verrucomicrobiae bacterium]
MKKPKFEKNCAAGLTLVEVLVSLGISVVAVTGIVMGYLFATGSAQRSSLYLAAGARALERVEQIRSAKWDTSSWPTIDQLQASNFPASVVTLCLPTANAPAVYGTNFTQISQISSNPPVKLVRVDCVWNRGTQLITNTIQTCRTPDQ